MSKKEPGNEDQRGKYHSARSRKLVKQDRNQKSGNSEHVTNLAFLYHLAIQKHCKE